MENQITKEYSLQQEEATTFFNAQASENAVLKAASGSDFYTDKDGLIEIICGYKLQNDPVVNTKLAELKSILIELTAIVTTYVKRYSEKFRGNYKTDIELWEKALSMLPLMEPSKIDSQRYDRSLKGIDIPADLANFIVEVTNGNADTMNAFSNFLQNQGNYLNRGINENNDSYKTITAACCIEVIRVGSETVYVPKIKLFSANFDNNNSKWSSLCASYEVASMNFEYSYAANSFNYQALNDPQIKKDFNNFIDRMQKEPIENAPTFFNGDF